MPSNVSPAITKLDKLSRGSASPRPRSRVPTWKDNSTRKRHRSLAAGWKLDLMKSESDSCR
ncbi:hypothetical protein D9611_006075 [Ephemerocybe angulata]|uniref:Uncharacterized protein n=1 Tax=Ephemerocybe angulata TaxID=980116 RepID=A0A8H5FLG8_9AGAR|nr:hypothetical protein D9611_006075 [Tulosesus angulatus]